MAKRMTPGDLGSPKRGIKPNFLARHNADRSQKQEALKRATANAMLSGPKPKVDAQHSTPFTREGRLKPGFEKEGTSTGYRVVSSLSKAKKKPTAASQRQKFQI